MARPRGFNIFSIELKRPKIRDSSGLSNWDRPESTSLLLIKTEADARNEIGMGDWGREQGRRRFRALCFRARHVFPSSAELSNPTLSIPRHAEGRLAEGVDERKL